MESDKRPNKSARQTAARRARPGARRRSRAGKTRGRAAPDSATESREAAHSDTAAPEFAGAAEQILGANPMIGLDRQELAGAIRGLIRLFAVRPASVAREELALLGELGRVMAGSSTVQPDPSDRRFRHEIWAHNAFYKRLMQGYLAWRRSLNNVLDSADVPEDDRKRARFALQLFTEALAPTNTLLGNPGALKRIAETRGRSLLYGARNMLNDLLYNGGMPRQVDEGKFRVGHNLAVTPGRVVFRNDVLELIQYQPATREVYERPLLIVPPQINKFYIVDLARGRSFAEYATQRGVQLFTISWRNPTATLREWNLETYLSACKEAIDAVRDICASSAINVLAACAGGYTLATLLGHLAASGERKVHSATFLVTVLDTECPTLMGLFASRSGIAAAMQRSRARGVLEGRDMARIFSWLRPNDLIWLFVANNWVMGNDPPAFDVLYWNSDTTRLPAEFHADMLSLFLHNPLVKADKLKALGTLIDMQQVTSDTFVVAGITDHITPWKACYETRKILGGAMEFVLSSSGHIQAIVNPPGNPRAKFYTNPDLSLEADQWLAGARENPGSWWDYWLRWYGERAGAKRLAPSQLGNDHYPPGDKAPGRYVHQR